MEFILGMIVGFMIIGIIFLISSKKPKNKIIKKEKNQDPVEYILQYADDIVVLVQEILNTVLYDEINIKNFLEYKNIILDNIIDRLSNIDYFDISLIMQIDQEELDNIIWNIIESNKEKIFKAYPNTILDNDKITKPNIRSSKNNTNEIGSALNNFYNEDTNYIDL